eukprot:3014660-Pyramimonas_sp.AAC.2
MPSAPSRPPSCRCGLGPPAELCAQNAVGQEDRPEQSRLLADGALDHRRRAQLLDARKSAAPRDSQRARCLVLVQAMPRTQYLLLR